VSAIEGARQLGRTVPDSLSVIGFDNTDHPAHAGPELTTMAVDKIGMGRLAVVMLEHRMANPDAAVSCTTLMPTLLNRQTVAPVKEV
jgi:LacI family transcriptional regulator